MDNIAFQLPATPAKTELPTVRKKESVSGKAASPFNRLLDQTMSSQQSPSVSDEEQTRVEVAPNEQGILMSQGVANSLILALVTAPPNVITANAEQAANHPDAQTVTTPTQIAGSLLRVANQLASTPPQNNFVDAQLGTQESEATQMLTNTPLLNPSSDKTVFIADGQASQLLVRAGALPKQPETNTDNQPQAELQAKLSAVISTTVNPFNLVTPIGHGAIQPLPEVTSQLAQAPVEPPQSAFTAKLSTPQTELPKALSDEKVIPDAVLTPKQLQFSSPETSELPLANQPVTPPGGRERMVVKQPADTELSTVAPLQAQSLLNQQSQDDNDLLSRDSFPANHGLSELRTDKLREPVFDTTQLISTPNQQEIVRQIVDHARLYLRPANQSEMVLQLRPEHLGELTLKVSVESGIVSATFHSDNPEVRQVIEASLPQLKQDLSQQGIKLDSVSVFSGSEQFFDNRQPSAQQQQSVPLRKNRRELMQAIEAAEEVSVSTRDGVDYRI